MGNEDGGVSGPGLMERGLGLGFFCEWGEGRPVSRFRLTLVSGVATSGQDNEDVGTSAPMGGLGSSRDITPARLEREIYRYRIFKKCPSLFLLYYERFS
jgi:hypothetical protein